MLRLYCLKRLLPGLLLACTVAAAPGVYLIRPAEGSRFALEVYKTGLMTGKKHVFHFQRYTGSVAYDPEMASSSKVEMSIDAGSSVVMDDWIGEGNRKKVLDYAETDMLDVKNHPHIRFASSRVTKTPDGSFEVAGDLTIRGIAKPVVVLVKMTEAGSNLRFTGTARVDLKDYGIKPRSAFLFGTKSVMGVDFALAASRADQ